MFGENVPPRHHGHPARWPAGVVAAGGLISCDDRAAGAHGGSRPPPHRPDRRAGTRRVPPRRLRH
ncbi:hypothetical protein LT493_24425 [Streptomyces tricolor]|nr:hypothetical protein [Streptomyces tricolor]